MGAALIPRAQAQFGGSAQTSTNAAAAASARAAKQKRDKEKKEAEQAAATRLQEQAQAEAKGTVSDPAATLLVHDGDPIELKVIKEVTSKTAKAGDPVFVELAQDIKVGDVVVARAGSHGMGEVIWAQKAGFIGMPGELEVRLDYLIMGEKKIYLRGTAQPEGGAGRQAGAAVLTFTGGVGLFIKGKQMVLPEGTVLKADLGQDAKLPPA
jgi:hypothetical protein